MRIMKLAALAIAGASLMGLTGCVSTMLLAGVHQASLSSSWKADYVDKTDSDRVTVELPIQKLGESAMLRFQKSTPRAGGDSLYSLNIDYTNAVGLTAYDSVKFIVDGQSTIIPAGPTVEGGSVASDMVLGGQWSITYSKDVPVITDVSLLAPDLAKKLFADILASKTVVVKNYQKGAGDKFINYTFTAADVALFSHL